MQVPVDDAIDLINSALEGMEVGNPNSSLTPQELEQIASICARKPITLDPKEVQDLTNDWQQQQAAQAAQAAQQAQAAAQPHPGPVGPSGWVQPPTGAWQPAAQQVQQAQAMAPVVANEPKAQPQAVGPEFNPSRGRKSSFDEQLEALLAAEGK